MKALIQRVSNANVVVEGETVGAIDQGLLLFLGVERNDTSETVKKLADKVMAYRVFADEQGKMNLNIQQVGGGLLIVSQFTLAAETRKGNRPGFSLAATPDVGERLYEEFVEYCDRHIGKVATGRFGADMKVSLTNDGPVTFLLEMQ